MKIFKLLLAFLLLSLKVLGQQADVSPAFWKMTNVWGQLKLSGLYKEHEIKRGTYLDDHAQSSYLSGGIILNANSFFWHPNFLQLDLGLEYSPEQSRDNYQIIPDEGEIKTLKKFDLRTTLFQKKIVTLTTFATISQTFSKREYLSDFRTDSKSWGGVFFLKSRILPLSISFQQGKTVQDEMQTARLFSYESDNLEGRTSQSFGQFNKNELILSHHGFKRIEKELSETRNDRNEATLNNELFFDRQQKYRFYSMINVADQKGYDTLRQVQAMETVSFKLPGNFELTGNYSYYDIDRDRQRIKQQTSKGILRHKLFESLNSSIFYEYIDARQTAFDQIDRRQGVDLAYAKKIPAGLLSLSYHYSLQHQEKKGESSYLKIYKEEYVLTDGLRVRIKRPYVDAKTVSVTDITGNIIYKENFDYLLTWQNDYLYIQRIPGGLISNNSSVFLYYTALVPGMYQYDMKNESWSAGLAFFKQLIGVYYRKTKQDYINLKMTDFVTLNYYTQEVYGCRFEYKAFTGGVEFDDNNSSILPYKLKRLYVSFQGQIRQKLLFSLNGNLSEYHLVKENLNQQYADVSGQLVYNLTPKSKINLDLGYRHQSGQGIDLELLNTRIEYSTQLRQLFFTVGLQSFQRNYMQEIDNFNGAFFRITRRF